MTLAPNETKEQYERKTALFKLQEARELTLDELMELRSLTRAAASHLIFNYPARK